MGNNNCCYSTKEDPDYMQSINPNDSIKRLERRRQTVSHVQYIRRVSLIDGINKNANVRPGQEKLEKFMNRHKLERLVYNSKGGLFESYLCATKGTNTRQEQYGSKSPQKKSKLKVLQSMKITRDNLKKAQERIDKLQTLDQNEIEPLLDAFHSESRVFILNNFSGQGNRDLYMLANIRGNFSEADIG